MVCFHILSNCIQTEPLPNEATHAENCYLNTKCKLFLLRWCFDVCNLKCKHRVSGVYDSILAALCASIFVNKSLYHLVHNPRAVKMFYLELRRIFDLPFVYYCPLRGTTLTLDSICYVDIPPSYPCREKI
jgi:hypothetical protein